MGAERIRQARGGWGAGRLVSADGYDACMHVCMCMCMRMCVCSAVVSVYLMDMYCVFLFSHGKWVCCTTSCFLLALTVRLRRLDVCACICVRCGCRRGILWRQLYLIGGYLV